jgi:hypothetical protein
MKLLSANLRADVTSALLDLRGAVEDARNQGLVAELPEEVEFEIELITDYQGLEEVQSNTDSKTSSGTQMKGEGLNTTTQIKSPAKTVTTQAQPASVSESVQTTPAETITTTRSGGGNVASETHTSQQAENTSEISSTEVTRKMAY